uniref:Poly(3-hydroxybutyrate) depolymerase n=1 Tax=Neobodo designis TaxID=312471 RepID=A0A7S1WAE2_NEODS|mmetsp:Transcript_9206/g.28557  ORF Transcript_9206/g.28557 Transcript_9206/m.28557 type:complete len:353 (+) Transcript_9206:112-1170(+)
MARMLAALAVAFVATAAFAGASPTISGDTLTISGISAGGAMAVQYEVAHSSKVRAAGVIAGVPYYCAQSNVYVALDCMSEPYIIDNPALVGEMREYEAVGAIDAMSNIKSHAVVLFSGTQDTVVAHGTMVALAQQYTLLGLSQAAVASNDTTPSVRAIFNVPAEHSWVTNFYGDNCDYLGKPYLNNCGVDFAGAFLRAAWLRMGLPELESRGQYNPANLHTFSQAAFGGSSSISMDTIGYVYIPDRCKASAPAGTTCHVHVNFHGCEQTRGTVGDVYVSHTGLNEYAETNAVIVVYPQATVSPLLPYNPKGCFDWWGYTGSHYADKYGAQIAFTNAVVARLMETGSLPAGGW